MTKEKLVNNVKKAIAEDVAEAKKLKDGPPNQFNIGFDNNGVLVLNQDPDTGQVSIVLSDDPTNTTPTSFSALFEMKSTSACVMFNTLTTAQMNAITDPQSGMVIHNSDDDEFYAYSAIESEWLPLSRITTPTHSTLGGILSWGGTAGNIIVDSGIVINPLTNDMLVPSGSVINFQANADFQYSLGVNSSLTANTSLIFPATPATAGQVLTALDDQGNTGWTDFNNIQGGFNTANGITGIVINNSSVTTASLFNITRNLGASGLPPVTGIGNFMIGSIIDNVSFTVYSTVVNDNTSFNWSFVNASSSDVSGFSTFNGMTGVVINCSVVTSTSLVDITRNLGASGIPSVVGIGNFMVGSIIDNVSFTVYSTVVGDNTSFNWSVRNP